MDTADYNYVESLIERARAATRIARDVADGYELGLVAERLQFALDFQLGALANTQLLALNPDGTTGPEHVTSEGVELDPPKG